jgi:uncharacterized protein YneF (UPF0154 family)
MGTPPYGQPAAQSNTPMILGVVGLVVGLLCCSPAGIVLGYLSMKKAKEQGQSTTLGKVAMIVSIVALVIGIIAGLSGVFSGNTSP